MNGAQVGDMFAQEVPVFMLSGDSEIEIFPNPDLPAYAGVWVMSRCYVFHLK